MAVKRGARLGLGILPKRGSEIKTAAVRVGVMNTPERFVCYAIWWKIFCESKRLPGFVLFS